MATSHDQAKKAWHLALKQRRHLSRQLEKLKDDATPGTDIARFDAIDDSMEQFRLACVHTIFLDFEYALSETTEDILWKLHVTINAKYRKILDQLRQGSRVVEKRKVETKYGHFLRIAQKFYKGYIQRLSALYDIKELKRVARGIEADEMHVKDIITPVPAELAAKVLTSCHLTLIRLGDLARYRVQAKHKKSHETILAYYSLARDLIPDSGFSFHQIGIVYLEEGNHDLDVVYHFYRAWAIKDPHPMAKQNLESKFSKGRPNNSSASSGRSPRDAFSMWFVRLHALFYKGEPVSPQHSELEREVMHRLAMAAKDPNAAPVLFKMSLVNIAACYVASVDYKQTNMESSSRFYQYIFHFTVRFILKICEVIESELRDSRAHQPSDLEGQNDENPKSRNLKSLLPALRIQCVWIAAYRSEIFGPASTLGHVVPALVGQGLARVLTLLCAEVYNAADSLAPCPYLLPEDLEVRGLRPFDDDNVPPACRIYCVAEGELKPHLELQSERFDDDRENMARVLDILRCAYFLTEDSVKPLKCGVVDGQLVFEYQDGESVVVPDNITADQIAVSSSVNGALEGPRNSVTAKEPAQGKPVAQEEQVPAVAVDNSPRHHQAQGLRQDSKTLAQSLSGGNLGELDDADNTVVNMLSPFLECPTPKSEKNRSPSDETSYGMHTNTANELAQELLKTFRPETEEPGPSYESRLPGEFGPSTWNHFFTPTGSKAADHSGTSSGHWCSSHSSQGSMRVSKGFEDPFTSPGYRAMGNLQFPVVNNAGSTGASSAEDSRKSQLLQAFGGSPGPSREPSSGQWPKYQDQKFPGNSRAQGVSPWGQPAPTGAPLSSGVSGFSHLSSLYQGTPSNGVWMAYGMPAYDTFGNNGMQKSTTQENTSTVSGHFQMNDKASSYDAAVLQSALQGNK